MDDTVKQAFAVMAEQVSIMRDLADRRALKFRSEVGAELSKHQRDQHGACWDYKYWIEQQRSDEAAISALLDRFGRNQTKLVELLGTV